MFLSPRSTLPLGGIAYSSLHKTETSYQRLEIKKVIIWGAKILVLFNSSLEVVFLCYNFGDMTDHEQPVSCDLTVLDKIIKSGLEDPRSSRPQIKVAILEMIESMLMEADPNSFSLANRRRLSETIQFVQGNFDELMVTWINKIIIPVPDSWLRPNLLAQSLR